jgi:cellulose synthase/poly-beta-1,6-N-acetylglucosamine synthase-like glycosyltransferase
MYKQKRVIVVMPAYNAASTLRQTYDEVMAQNVVDLVIVVDDASRDQTTAVARHLPNTVVHTHADNRGEVSCPTNYFPEASSINLWRSIKYGVGCLFTAVSFRLAKMKLIDSKLFPRHCDRARPKPAHLKVMMEKPEKL